MTPGLLVYPERIDPSSPWSDSKRLFPHVKTYKMQAIVKKQIKASNNLSVLPLENWKCLSNVVPLISF